MLNLKKQFKSKIQEFTKMKWWEKIMAFEILLFCIAIIIMHKRGACGELDWRAGYCVEYISFFEFYGYKYFYLVLNLAFILISFLKITSMVGHRINKKTNKNDLYKKVFNVELCCLVSVLFAVVLLFVVVYGGYSCLLGNCTNTPLVLFILFWGLFLLIPLLFNPIALGIIGVPYLVAFFYENFEKLKKEKELKNKNSK